MGLPKKSSHKSSQVKQVCVTGVSGFVGKNLVGRLLNEVCINISPLYKKNNIIFFLNLEELFSKFRSFKGFKVQPKNFSILKIV